MLLTQHESGLLIMRSTSYGTTLSYPRLETSKADKSINETYSGEKNIYRFNLHIFFLLFVSLQG